MIRVLLAVPSPAPARLHVEGERHHYLSRVLRVKPGDAVEVFDGRGHAWNATVAAVDEDAVELALGPAREAAPASRRVTVIQGLPKGDKLEWIVEKATELGAYAIAPVRCERSIVKLDAARSEKKRERWQKIAEEAARQCRRSEVPKVLPVMSLEEAARTAAGSGALLILDEEERTRRLSEALPSSDAPVALVVGPEGGLSREEIQRLILLGGVPVTLGDYILRTETAALAALSVLRHRDGQLG
ncbi:MAG: 16S rRNA (uracil(1498)-N(3))-methyltransferase [Myxococcaceae bacterium]|nr:16S rRNA (uracil(1498)-N(3))-methyltransferase [Myxococcaceae bacterium]